MGLFNIFSKKNNVPPSRDITWISTEAKWKGALTLLKGNPNAIVIAWFQDTLEIIEKILSESIINSLEVKLAKNLSASSLTGKTIIFLEHFPSHSKEIALVENSNATELIFLNALDEPLFQYFGGSNIQLMMEKMGMGKDEQIEHSLISKSIKNIQNKIEAKMVTEHSANSQMDWMRKNAVK